MMFTKKIHLEYNYILRKFDYYIGRPIDILGNRAYQYTDKVKLVCKLKLKKQ